MDLAGKKFSPEQPETLNAKPSLCLTYCHQLLEFSSQEIKLHNHSLWLLSNCSFLGRPIFNVRAWRAVECRVWSVISIASLPQSHLFSPYQGFPGAGEH